MINLLVYEFLKRSLWLLIVCWSHFKIMLKTKKISFKLDTYVSHECHTIVSVRYVSNMEHAH